MDARLWPYGRWFVYYKPHLAQYFGTILSWAATTASHVRTLVDPVHKLVHDSLAASAPTKLYALFIADMVLYCIFTFPLTVIVMSLARIFSSRSKQHLCVFVNSALLAIWLLLILLAATFDHSSVHSMLSAVLGNEFIAPCRAFQLVYVIAVLVHASAFLEARLSGGGVFIIRGLQLLVVIGMAIQYHLALLKPILVLDTLRPPPPEHVQVSAPQPPAPTRSPFSSGSHAPFLPATQPLPFRQTRSEPESKMKGYFGRRLPCPI